MCKTETTKSSLIGSQGWYTHMLQIAICVSVTYRCITDHPEIQESKQKQSVDFVFFFGMDLAEESSNHLPHVLTWGDLVGVHGP